MITSLIAGGTVVASIIEMMQVFCVGLGIAGQLIIAILTGMGGLTSEIDFSSVFGFIGGQVEEFGDSAVFSIRDVIFNRSNTTTASFFYRKNFNMGLDDAHIDFSKGIAADIFSQVSTFYYLMRNISIAALLFILLYIGIRMAISTVASDEAKYKKMLKNWAVSMALIFVLQFIMIATLYVNNTLVNILYDFSGGSQWKNTLNMMQIAGQGLVPVVGLGEAIVFVMSVGMELTFVLMYIKRVITLAFLIVIAPLITITYSIDKIGDNKSQALDTWLKEFMFTVLIQPFHCIIYIVLIQTALSAIAGVEGLGAGVIYIVMLKFMKEAEDIVRKIFGIRSDSMPGFKGMGVMALGVMGKLGSSSSKGGSSGGKGGNKYKDMPDLKETQKKLNNPNPPTPPPPPPPGPGPSPVKDFIKKGVSDYNDKISGMVERRGGVKGLINTGVKRSAQLAGFGLGLGMTGEIEQAIAFSSIAKGQAEGVEDFADDLSYRKKLKEAEKVYKQELKMFAQSVTPPGGSYSDGINAAEEFRKKLSNNELDKKSFTPQQERFARIIDDMDDFLGYGDIPDSDKYMKKLANEAEDELKATPAP